MVKNAIVLANNYGKKGEKLLANDLCEYLISKDYKVTLISYGEVNLYNISDEKLEEIVIKLNNDIKYLKYLLTWVKLLKITKKISRRNLNYELGICFAPLTVLMPGVLIFNKMLIKKRVCIIFDIFPRHQIIIKKIPKYFYLILKYLEIKLLRGFSTITGMTPKNIEKIKLEYRLENSNKEFIMLPPWGMKYPEKLNVIRKKKSRKIKFVFGGQVIAGRQLSKAIYFLSRIKKRGVNMSLTIFTNNRIELNENWVNTQKRLPRKEYLEIISDFDLGLVITDKNVDLPTFPSKIIDYLSAGLRCFCIVEPENDINEVLDCPNLIFINKFDFSDDSVQKAIEFIYKVPDENQIKEEIKKALEKLSIDALSMLLST
jgi:hypothetical protein